jgi:hypothetical protein
MSRWADLDELAAGTVMLASDGIDSQGGEDGQRHLVVTRASSIRPRPVHWLWQHRIPLGELTLLGGREGIGKSMVGYTLCAWITTGIMDGHYFDEPRVVIVVATEDSWEHTIVPRLMAAGANLDLVCRVDAVTTKGLDGVVTLPKDLVELERLVIDLGAVLVLLDPLMSRLSATLDTHKDAEVRIALEPLTAFAKRARAAVLGIIHVNKGVGTDPLTLIMGSRAFTAVARAVLVAMKDPEDDGRVLLGLEKSNLGTLDVPTCVYTITSVLVTSTDEGDVFAGKVKWLEETNRSVSEAMATAGEGPDAASASSEATNWLSDYLESVGGGIDSATAKKDARKAGHSDYALRRARTRLKVRVEDFGYPRRTYWMLPGPSGVDSHGETPHNNTTNTTERNQGN